MHKYQNNAFRVLGLLPSASIQQVTSRASEIRVKRSLGVNVVYPYDFPWMGPLDRSDENVINALQRLEDPFARLKEETFWFWIESDDDKKALEYLTQNKRQPAHEIWKKIAYNKKLDDHKADSPGAKPSKEAIRACLNETILAHSSVIAKESDVKYHQEELREQRILVNEESEVFCCPECQKIYDKEWKICLKCGVGIVSQKNERKEKVIKSRDSNAVLNEVHWKNWRFAVNNFALLHSSDCFWLEVSKRIKYINDPRLPESRINDFKSEFFLEVTEPNFKFISRALSSKDHERTKWHSNLLNGLSLPSSILKNGFNKILSYHIDLLNKYCADATKEISQFNNGAEKDFVLGTYSRFSDQVKDIIYEGNLVDINCISDFALARDNVAGVLRSFSVEVHNRCHDVNKSYEIITEAVECASSSYLKQKFEKDVVAIRRNLFSPPEGSKEQASSSKGIKEILKSIPWWVWVGGAWLLITILSSSKTTTSTRSPSSGANSYRSQGNQRSSEDSASLSVLKAKIESLKVTIAQQEKQITELREAGEQKGNELTALKMETDNIENQYQNSSYIPEYVRSSYERKIQEYNNLVPIYNRAIEQEKELYSDYERNLAEANSLVAEYNRKIGR